jgi:hypothetical protein
MILSGLIHRGFRHAVHNAQGTDVLEYALVGGFVAVAAGAILPSVAAGAGSIFSMVHGALNDATLGQTIGH